MCKIQLYSYWDNLWFDIYKQELMKTSLYSGTQLCMNVYNWSKIYWYEKLTLTGGRHVHMYMWFTFKLTPPPPLSSTNSSQNWGQGHCNVNDIYLLILEWGGGYVKILVKNHNSLDLIIFFLSYDHQKSVR